MADIDDVLTGLAAACTGAVYPKGTGQPSVAGVDIRVYPGWPAAAGLDADLKAGKVNVSLYPLQIERNTTRFQRIWQGEEVQAATLTLALNADEITVGGTQPETYFGHNLAVLINGTAYVYTVQPGDTLTMMATGLAAAIAVDWPLTTSSGPVVTVGGLFVTLRTGDLVIDASGNPITADGNPTPIVVRVGTVGTAVREIRRQKRLFQITVWAPTPETRKQVAGGLDVLLSNTAFLTMPDGTAAHVMYFDSPMTDGIEKSRIYRRDLRYFIEYATTESQTAPTVVAGRVASQDPVTGINTKITDY